MVEQGCLLSSYTGKTGVGGSNPPLSAMQVPRAPGFRLLMIGRWRLPRPSRETKQYHCSLYGDWRPSSPGGPIRCRKPASKQFGILNSQICASGNNARSCLTMPAGAPGLQREKAPGKIQRTSVSGFQKATGWVYRSGAQVVFPIVRISL